MASKSSKPAIILTDFFCVGKTFDAEFCFKDEFNSIESTKYQGHNFATYIYIVNHKVKIEGINWIRFYAFNTTFNMYFRYIEVVNFIGGENLSTQEPVTKKLTNFII